MTTTTASPTSTPTPRRSTVTIAAATAVWSGLYACAALAWSLGAPGFPFGPQGDPGEDFAFLSGARPETTGPVIAALAAAAAGLAGYLALSSYRGRPLTWSTRTAAITVAALLSALLAVVVPDIRVLARIGYAPIFLIGAPFGFPDGAASYWDSWTWPVINHLICLIGGFGWAAVAVRLIPDRRPLLTAAVRWSGWATAVAALIPLIYAVERIAWSLGIPLGIDQAMLEELNSGPGQWAALGLGLGALGGAVLTLGLVQRWGTVFPFWIPFLRGRRVPPAVAIVPAGFVAAIVTAAGVCVLRVYLSGSFEDGTFAAIWPALLWPLWGLGLAVATVGYYHRRQDG
jgi:hypothetical protein